MIFIDCALKCKTCSSPSGACTTCRGNRGSGTNAVAAPTCSCADGTYDDGNSTNCLSNFNFF